MNRRQFIQSSGLAIAAASGGIAGLAHATAESALIYLSPLQSNGALSRCQAEVWFVSDGPDMCVVTDKDAWRAKAVEQGLAPTQVWVGDVGLWQKSDGAYKNLPSMRAGASFERNADKHAQLLSVFGRKYAREWDTWGPRFKKGLADGSRVMLRYTPAE